MLILNDSKLGSDMLMLNDSKLGFKTKAWLKVIKYPLNEWLEQAEQSLSIVKPEHW